MWNEIHDGIDRKARYRDVAAGLAAKILVRAVDLVDGIYQAVQPDSAPAPRILERQTGLTQETPSGIDSIY